MPSDGSLMWHVVQYSTWSVTCTTIVYTVIEWGPLFNNRVCFYGKVIESIQFRAAQIVLFGIYAEHSFEARMYMGRELCERNIRGHAISAFLFKCSDPLVNIIELKPRAMYIGPPMAHVIHVFIPYPGIVRADTTSAPPPPSRGNV